LDFRLHIYKKRFEMLASKRGFLEISML